MSQKPTNTTESTDNASSKLVYIALGIALGIVLLICFVWILSRRSSNQQYT